MSHYLKKLGYTDIASDQDDRSIVFSFDGNKVALVNMNFSGLGYTVEVMCLFAPELLSLKTYTDIANMFFKNKCSISGLRNTEDGRTSFNVAYNIGEKITKTDIEIAMVYIQKALSEVHQYLIRRVAVIDNIEPDLSMFEDVSLQNFHPQTIAEKKEFVYGSWDAYEKKIAEEYNGFVDHPANIEALAKIEACRQFEEKNEAPLSDVGEYILDELVLTRRLQEIAKTTYSIN